MGQEFKVSNQKRPWFLPKHAVLQVGGNIGMVAGGFGYRLLKNKINTDILYGFTPAFEAPEALHSFTGKVTLQPFNLKAGKKYHIIPLKLGSGISYTAGSQFHTKWPSRYPKDYYWWSSSIRFTPFIGVGVSNQVGSGQNLIKGLELYTEVGTHDLHLVNYTGNNSLELGQILNVALGSKVIF